MAVTDQIPKGFIEWSGGDNPVPGKMVEVYCRLEISMGRMEVTPSLSDDLRWGHKERGGDIIAYRVTSQLGAAGMTADEIDQAVIQTLREMVAISPEHARGITARLRHANLLRKGFSRNVCAVCGFTEDKAVHQPLQGGTNARPWGHAFQPQPST